MYMRDLTSENTEWVTVKENIASDVYALTTDGDRLILVTNEGAPNTKIVVADAANPSVENWQDLVPEMKNVLTPSTAGGNIFAEYMVDAISQVKQYDLQGELIRTVELPSKGSVESSGRSLGDIVSFKGKRTATYTYYMFENYTQKACQYECQLKKTKEKFACIPWKMYHSDHEMEMPVCTRNWTTLFERDILLHVSTCSSICKENCIRELSQNCSFCITIGLKLSSFTWVLIQ